MQKKKTKSTASKEKSKFRQSARWRKIRAFKKKECSGIDYITGKKLLKGFQLHHKDMRLENYTRLEPDRFICLNKMSHEMLHFLYNYYKNDTSIIERIRAVLEEMKKFNSD